MRTVLVERETENNCEGYATFVIYSNADKPNSNVTKHCALTSQTAFTNNIKAYLEKKTT